MSESMEPAPPAVAVGEKLAGAGAGAIVGLGMTNQLWPAVINPANHPDISISSRLMLGSGVGVQDGTVGIQAPRALEHVTALPVGVHATFTRLPFYLTGPNNLFKTFAEMAHQVPNLADQTALTLGEHLAAGTISGAVLGYLAARTVGFALRERSLDKRIAELPHLSRAGKFGAALATLVLTGVTAGCGKTLYTNFEPINTYPSAPLIPEITGNSPLLRGAYETGIGRQDFLKVEQNYAEVVNAVNGGAPDTANVDAIKSFERAYHKAEETGPLTKLNNNPDLLKVQVLGDVHDYEPGFALMQAELTAIAPDIVVDVGDDQDSSGHTSLDKLSLVNEVKLMKAAATANRMRLQEIRINADHDKKQNFTYTSPQLKIRTLRNAGQPVTVDGLTFIGADDPRHTIIYTTPSGTAALKAVVREGSGIAAESCKIMNQTGQAPIVITSDPLASEESLYKGCANIALNGETHHNSVVRMIYGRDGHVGYQHTVGTATGVNAGLLPVQQPLFPPLDMDESTLYINRHTDELEAVITEVVSPKGVAKIEDQSLSGNPTPVSPHILSLIARFSPTAKQWLFQPKPRAEQ